MLLLNLSQLNTLQSDKLYSVYWSTLNLMTKPSFGLTISFANNMEVNIFYPKPLSTVLPSVQNKYTNKNKEQTTTRLINNKHVFIMQIWPLLKTSKNQSV